MRKQDKESFAAVCTYLALHENGYSTCMVWRYALMSERTIQNFSLLQCS
jgi:hypothetical protein